MQRPTEWGIRNDSQGMGVFGAFRKDRLHDGTDYICKPGQAVKAPISGVITRIATPYKDDDRFSGVEIVGVKVSVIMFYLDPIMSMVGGYVRKGEVLGYAQDISVKYGGGMLPHIHLRIIKCDPELLMSNID